MYIQLSDVTKGDFNARLFCTAVGDNQLGRSARLTRTQTLNQLEFEFEKRKIDSNLESSARSISHFFSYFHISLSSSRVELFQSCHTPEGLQFMLKTMTPGKTKEMQKPAFELEKRCWLLFTNLSCQLRSLEMIRMPPIPLSQDLLISVTFMMRKISDLE